MNIAKQVAGKVERFAHWSECLSHYQHAIWHPETLSEESYKKANINFLGVLDEIFRFFRDNAGVRDEWESPARVHVYPLGQQIWCQSRKQSEEYRFGIYGDTFRLEVGISNAWNIKHMPNEFWALLTETYEYGALSFNENAVLRSSQEHPIKPELLRAARSDIYKMIRNYILFEQASQGPVYDLGFLEMAWPCGISWATLLEKGTHAFRCLHRLNYRLWRCEYQREQVVSKRLRKEYEKEGALA